MRTGLAIVLLAGVAALAGCGGSSAPSSSSSSSSKPFVVLVTDINQLNDHGFNQLANEGLMRSCDVRSTMT